MIEMGRDVVNNLTVAAELEWLVTNGIGGYASGTVAGLLSRRYHGLLVAALKPPLGRTVMLTKLDETVQYGGQAYRLFSNQWKTETAPIKPDCTIYMDRFHLDGTLPVWTFRLADALIEKRIWMTPGRNITYVQYTYLSGKETAHLTLQALVNYTDFHEMVQMNGRRMIVQLFGDGVRVTAHDDARPFHVSVTGAEVVPHHVWYRSYFNRVEYERGFPPLSDHLHAATFHRALNPGESLTVVASAEQDTALDPAESLAQRQAAERGLIDLSHIRQHPDWIEQLILAADQFIVQRPSIDDPDGHSVIAGYHWFGDWGRDTMIALPGLCLTTGREAEAASILRTFARYVSQGMLPNRFPDVGDVPEYNTVDATLWYFEAIRDYVARTGDTALLADVMPVLRDIITWHHRGTRYGIHVAPEDGLLYAGEPGVQLTWMDVKIGEWVVTPRRGKPVEINALWYNALRSMAGFAHTLGHDDAASFDAEADRVQASFERFWCAEQGWCYDVLDAPLGHDDSLRPNQLFAVSLHHAVLTGERAQAVVDVCQRHLLTPFGLRSLAPFAPDYAGRYAGDPTERDSVYHQGTVWAWLIGPFVAAHLKVYHDPMLARSFLEPFRFHLRQMCIGTIAEIFDGDAPHRPTGAAAQAWSVAEVLRAWQLIEEAE